VSVRLRGGVRVWRVGGEKRIKNRKGRKEKWVGSRVGSFGHFVVSYTFM